jgi:hypothetical protein
LEFDGFHFEAESSLLDVFAKVAGIGRIFGQISINNCNSVAYGISGSDGKRASLPTSLAE